MEEFYPKNLSEAKSLLFFEESNAVSYGLLYALLFSTKVKIVTILSKSFFHYKRILLDIHKIRFYSTFS